MSTYVLVVILSFLGGIILTLIGVLYRKINKDIETEQKQREKGIECLVEKLKKQEGNIEKNQDAIHTMQLELKDHMIELTKTFSNLYNERSPETSQ